MMSEYVVCRVSYLSTYYVNCHLDLTLENLSKNVKNLNLYNEEKDPSLNKSHLVRLEPKIFDFSVKPYEDF